MDAGPAPPPPDVERARPSRLQATWTWATGPVVRMWHSHDPLDAYALVHMAGAAGDALVALALADSVFFSLKPGAARTHVALYLGLTMAPLAVAGPLLVPLLDRGRSRMRATTSGDGGACPAWPLPPWARLASAARSGSSSCCWHSRYEGATIPRTGSACWRSRSPRAALSATWWRRDCPEACASRPWWSARSWPGGSGPSSRSPSSGWRS